MTWEVRDVAPGLWLWRVERSSGRSGSRPWAG
jgi:hypothetical protein